MNLIKEKKKLADSLAANTNLKLNETKIAQQEVHSQLKAMQGKEGTESVIAGAKIVEESLNEEEHWLKQLKIAQTKLSEINEKKYSSMQSYGVLVSQCQKMNAPNDRLWFERFMRDIKKIYREKNGKKCPTIFISYAWPKEPESRELFDDRILRLKEELNAAGVSVWWDKMSMEGHMEDQMQTNVAESDFVLVLCTPLYKQRATLTTEDGKPLGGVAIEVQHIMKKLETNKHSAIPVIFESGIESKVYYDHIKVAVPECFSQLSNGERRSQFCGG